MKIALVGFGNVGSAFIELLYEQREHLAKQYKFKPKVIAVIARRGTALSKTGFKRAADVKFDGKAILYEKAIRDAEVMVEVTPTDVQTGGIASRTLSRCFEDGQACCHCKQGTARRCLSRVGKTCPPEKSSTAF